MKVVVLNCAIGSWYLKGQDRLLASLRTHGFLSDQDHSLVSWRDCYPIGCPKKDVAPYAFKPYAFKHVIEQGFDIAIWFDASMWATSSIDPIIAHIDTHGVAVWRAGWSLAEWCHDAGLRKLAITRQDAQHVPLVCGGICGFDLRRAPVRALLRDWLDFASDGVSFAGSYSNMGEQRGSCSDDTICLGHRHDMPSLSYLVQRDGHTPIDCPKWFAYDSDKPDPQSIILARGM